jgi:hypothetical protein
MRDMCGVKLSLPDTRLFHSRAGFSLMVRRLLDWELVNLKRNIKNLRFHVHIMHDQPCRIQEQIKKFQIKRTVCVRGRGGGVQNKTWENKLFQRLAMESIKVKVGKDKKNRTIQLTSAGLLEYASCPNSKT